MHPQHTTTKRPAGNMLFSGKLSLTLFLLFMMASAEMLHAQGNLLITPRRVVFEGNKSSQEINLANTGQDSATYSVSFVQYRMNETGSFEQIEEPDPGQNFADKMIRYFPRSVTLAPGEAQMVRMQLRRSGNMEPGEYRSHMYFRAIPKESALGMEDQLEDTTAIGIRLTPIFGITIPVIVRTGDPEATVSLNTLSLENATDSTALLKLIFNRDGNRSVYGDLTVDYEPQRGSSIQVGLVRGIAVYTPNQIRQFEMTLKKPDGVDYSKGKLVVRYTNAEGDTDTLLAEKELLLE
jgi:P pilus assembly chaperone PapD